MKAPFWALCVGGPMDGYRMYRNGCDWKTGDFVELASAKEPQRLTNHRRWVTVSDIHTYQLMAPDTSVTPVRHWELRYVDSELAD